MKSDREKIGLTFDDDGEFWFAFCSHLYVCQISAIFHVISLCIEKEKV